MATKICPRCRTRYSVSYDNSDFVHVCQGDSTLQNEDLANIGTWEDYTGSGNTAKSQVFTAGVSNILHGTEGGLEGGKTTTYTVRGNIKATNRTRQHLEYINLK